VNTLLRTALLANAAFSAVSGLIFATRSDAVAGLIGPGDALIYLALGAGLLGFAALVAWVATRKPVNAFHALLISAADAGWVLGTALLIALLGIAAFQPAGLLALLAIAALVGCFCIAQLLGINRMFALTGASGTQRLTVLVDAPAPPDALWSRIADLGGIGRFSPNLARVLLREDALPGVGATRQCSDHNKRTWAEHCERFDPAERLVAMRFRADEPGFPYPFATMAGGWHVVPSGVDATVKIWFDVTPKFRLAQPLILGLMSRTLARGFAEIVTRMLLDTRGAPIPAAVNPADYGVAYRLVVQ
jgi:hypothetical protein